MPRFLSISVLSGLFLLSACSEQASQPAPAESSTSAISTEIEVFPAYSEFSTALTIRDVMNTLIDPHADALWSAVRYESDENGPREYFPETDAEWEALEKSAISIIEGGNALMIPGRRVAPAGATTDFPDFEFLPDEVAAMLAEDRDSWIGFVQALQQASLSTLEAVRSRNVAQLSENGALIDEACESCHSQYWYRAL